ncbi:MAG TPA: AAA family ATPase [Dehalococcoidia bacterium]|nr:AAA family ATPase [Dehalococcoidia bacterium]
MAKTVTIAVAGKGGTGKTTVAALLAQILAKQGTVLAIDADPSSNLHMCLGLPQETTVGAVREEAAKKVRSSDFPAGMSKASYLELGVRQTLVESDKIDLIAMGRPEGQGCYCAAINVLRGVIDQLARNYDFVVIDNEAGMEHISRQTTRDVDILLIMSDPSMRGVATAGMIKGLIEELRPHIGKMGLVINRVEGAIPAAVEKRIQELGIEALAVLPSDRELLDLEASGEPLTKLSDRSAVKLEVLALAKRLGLVNGTEKR